MYTHKNIIKRHFSTLVFILIVLAGIVSLACLSACSCATQGEQSTQNPPSADSQSSNSSNNDADEREASVVAEGSEAPDFSFTTIEGQTMKLSDLEGQVVLLNFWATWCGYCVEEMPAMQEITENYPDVVVLAINRGDNASKATTFAEDSGYDFIWGLDEDGAIKSLYPSNGIPYSLIIDEDGTITAIFEGSAPDMYPYFESAVVEAGA